MARIINTVGSLSTLKKELHKRNITQFHSIKDIKEFERTYLQQLEGVKEEIVLKLKSRLESISTDLDGLISRIKSKQVKAEEEVNDRIHSINKRIKTFENKKKNALQRFVTHIFASTLNRKIRRIENRRIQYIERSIKEDKIIQVHLKKKFDKLNDNFEKGSSSTEKGDQSTRKENEQTNCGS